MASEKDAGLSSVPPYIPHTAYRRYAAVFNPLVLKAEVWMRVPGWLEKTKALIQPAAGLHILIPVTALARALGPNLYAWSMFG